MKKLVLGFSLFFGVSSFSQNIITLKNGKQYPATQVWEFVSNSYVYDNIPKIQIVKTETGGLMKVSAKVSNENLYIGERIFINLKNNYVIYSVDKGMRVFTDGVASTYFSLNVKDLQQLKNHEIADVRFKIVGIRSNFDSQIGMFTASNKLTVFDAFSPDKKTIDTKTAIRDLSKQK